MPGRVPENLVSGEKGLNTKCIQAAIDAAAETGGTVVIPPGRFVTGTLVLRSNVVLHLEHGATLLGSTRIEDYPEHLPKTIRSYNDCFLRHSLIYAEDTVSTGITGSGTIDGQGAAFDVKTEEKPERYKNRPFLIRMVGCRNIRIENVTLQNSAMWLQQYLDCEDLAVRGIRVHNHCNKNNDMIDIDGCRNVVMSDCIGDSDDDAITLKSTGPYVTENVTITNCVVSSHCNALKFGTESWGGFRNITISNIVIKPSAVTTTIYGKPQGNGGITLASVDGGVFENVLLENIVVDGPRVPIFLRLGLRNRPYNDNVPPPKTGSFRNVQLRQITARSSSPIGCSITGIPGHRIENVRLSHVRLELPGGGTADDAVRDIPELEDHYPEGSMFGDLPACGFFIRHANNVEFDDVDLQLAAPDQRPVIYTESTDGFTIRGLKTDANAKAPVAIRRI